MRTTENDGLKKEKPYPVESSSKKEQDASEFDSETADLITAVQFGCYDRVVQLIEADPSLAQSEDTEKITPLHWAALNNRVEICQYLVEKGAKVDAVGGALRSTPLQWAVREGKLAATIFLISKNAEISMVDGQGFSAIHLASIFGYTEIVGYLVALGQDVNTIDQSGNTPLMHVAYNVKKRDPAQLLIRLGATINTQNPNNKYTALHCAIAGNNPHVIRILLDAGAKTHLRNADNEDVFDFAAKYQRNLLMLLITFGPSNEGLPRLLQFHTSTRRRALSLLPYITIFALISVLNIDLIWYYKLLTLALVIGFVYAYTALFHSFAVDNRIPISVAQATIFWLYASYLYYFLPYIHIVSMPMMILVILTYFSWRNFYLAQKTDPGYVSPVNRDQTNRLIIQLVERNLFDEDHFCTYCLVRRPLRSKHCRECRRCVAKFDHHCPWIDNCVGDKNLIYFVGFIFFTPLCLIMFLHGSYRYFDQHCNVFAAESFSDGFHQAFACGLPVVFLTGVAGLYAFWIFSLFVTIIVQVSSGLTTNERMNYWRYKYLHATRRSPFSFGIIQNLVDMLNRRVFSYTPITLDWLEIYTMDEFFQLTSDQFRRTLNV